jgi:hypothetical protein
VPSDNREFVPADTGDEVTLAHCPKNSLRDDDQ